MINKDDFFNVYSPERKFIAGSTYLYGYDARNLIINIRTITNGASSVQLKGYQIIKHSNQNEAYALSGAAKKIYQLGLESMQLEKLINVSTEPYAIELSPDQKWICIKYGEYGNYIELHDLDINRVKKLTLSSKHVDCFTFSPKNKYVLTGNCFGEIEIWDVNTVTRKGILFTSISHND
jgi:WD40 repeat protein